MVLGIETQSRFDLDKSRLTSKKPTQRRIKTCHPEPQAFSLVGIELCRKRKEIGLTLSLSALQLWRGKKSHVALYWERVKITLRRGFWIELATSQEMAAGFIPVLDTCAADTSHNMLWTAQRNKRPTDTNALCWMQNFEEFLPAKSFTYTRTVYGSYTLWATLCI